MPEENKSEDFNRSCISVKNYFKSPSGTSQPSFLYFEIKHESLFKAAQLLFLSNLPLRVVSLCTPGLRPLSLFSLDRGLEVQLCEKLSSYQGLVSLRQVLMLFGISCFSCPFIFLWFYLSSLLIYFFILKRCCVRLCGLHLDFDFVCCPDWFHLCS